ncbi:MAG: potassium transporter TrkG [Synergistaceae bacterium]|nr:potassium transporter TrkG [Synergistaceae bacterium]
MKVHTSYRVEQVIVLGFLLVILVGALLLWSSNKYLYDMPISIADALFVSTSAVCVTGLVTINLSTGLGMVSQLIILVLIQIGGLGIMTAVMMLGLVAGRRIGIKSRLFFLGGFGLDGVSGAVRLLTIIAKYTFVVETFGALLLYWGFIRHGIPVEKSIYYAVFHSVSAFCNAGFSPLPNGLNGFSLSIIVPASVMMLIILGGLGFPVFANCWDVLWKKGRLSHYSKLVLFLTFWLITLGTVMLLISDWNEGLAGLPDWARIWNALFTSVTTRTAGFDTVQPSVFSELGKILMIALMVIGASPASTGGGIKTTTLGVLAVAAWNEMLGRDENVFWHRKIGYQTVRRALAMSFMYLITFFIGAVVLSLIEDFSFEALLFEAVSAMGTVGLSLGITTELSVTGKMVLVALMFWGRVGILSFFATLIKEEKKVEIHFTEVNIPIG